MPKINVEKAFLFSPDGKSVVEVEAGEQEVSERCAKVAVEHLKVAILVGKGEGKTKPVTSSRNGEQPARPEPTPEE